MQFTVINYMYYLFYLTIDRTPEQCLTIEMLDWHIW